MSDVSLIEPTIIPSKPTIEFKHEAVSIYFSDYDKNSKEHNCKGCSNGKTISCNVKNHGIQNLFNHIWNQHKDELLSNITNKRNKLSSYFKNFSEKANIYYQYLSYIIACNEPFSKVENPNFREISKLPPISRRTLMNLFGMVAEEVSEHIRKILPKYFGIIFDGWTSKNNNHYVGIFAVYPVKDKVKESCKTLLAICPLPDETELSASNYRELINSTLEWFGKTEDNILYLSCDNCSTNTKLAADMNKPLIGCANHRLNLAVKNYIEFLYSDVVDKVHKIMVICKTIKNRAQLRNVKLDNYRTPVTNQETGWSSTYFMIEQFLQIKQSILSIDDTALIQLRPTYTEIKKIETLYKELIELNKVTVKLQSPDFTMAEVRIFFDATVMVHPIMSEYLSPNADIVKYKAFENGLVKLQLGMESSLSELETIAMLPFLKENFNDIIQSDVDDNTMNSNSSPNSIPGLNSTGESLSLFEIAEKELKRQKLDGHVRYVDTKFVSPTSINVERLFSYAKLTNDDKRQSTTPKNFEARLYLKYNRNLWNVYTVQSAIDKAAAKNLTDY